MSAQQGVGELATTPAGSFRKRTNSHSGPASLEGTAQYHSTDGSHVITIGSNASAVELLDELPDDKQIFLEYESLDAWVPAMAAPGGSFIAGLPSLSIPSLNFRKKAQPEQGHQCSRLKQVLFSITGCCRPREVLAFMGPSGSGKTTLLSIVGARAQSALKRTGSCLFNGQPLTKRLKRQIGYVMQDDLFYESLTVWETLKYAAFLRLPQHMSKDAKKQRVERVIAALGLQACKDTIIGGFFKKGISGGERKRAAIGHELLINPSVILLDEPTSGLDSTTAMHLLQLLRQLAQSGRAVVTTIHQPSSRLFQQLDKLLLLSKGHALYYGPAASTDEWFDRLGYRLPYRVNVADFILDISSGDVFREDRGGEESRVHLIGCAESYLAHHPHDGYDPTAPPEELHALRGSFRSRAALLPKADRVPNGHLQMQESMPKKGAMKMSEDVESGPSSASSSQDAQEAGTAPGLEVGLKQESVWGASYPFQLRIIFTRSVRSRRGQTLSGQDFFLFLAIGILSGLFWLQKCGHDTVAAAQNTLGLLFVQAVFLSFHQMFVALFTFPGEFKILLKERASGMYRLSAFYFARLASDLPLDFAIPTLFLVIVYFMGHLRYTAAAFFANYFTVILVMLVAQSWGLLIGTVVMNPKTGQTLAAVIMIVFMLTGGYFTRGIPVWISWFKYGSFIFYGYGLLAHIEFQDRQLYLCYHRSLNPGDVQLYLDLPDPVHNELCQPVSSTQGSLGLQQGVDSRVWTILNGCMLVFMLVVLRALAYIALRRKTTQL